jgi:GT2 family glycosyltransferase
VPRVSVVVPIFNGAVHLPEFFESLTSALPSGSQLILVNDASTERVFELVPDIPPAAEVVRLENDSNLGYATTVNRGFHVATGDIVVELNVDMILQPGTITSIVDLIERENRVGIVGSRLLFPTTNLVQHVGMAFGNFSQRHIYYELPSTHPLSRKTREVQITTGAIAGMTRRVLELIGPLDERYFNNNEDIDHCLRARQHGLRNFICAESVAHHWQSHSGAARFARIESTEGAFWSAWGQRVETDLGTFVGEALDHVLHSAPELASIPFQVLNLSRGADDAIVLDQLAERWPKLEQSAPFRQMSNSSQRLSISLLVPHWMATEPTPFIYLVDSYRSLEENALWFENRRRVVEEEIVVDLNAVALPTSEAYTPSISNQ